jgi:hypothetical protein
LLVEKKEVFNLTGKGGMGVETVASLIPHKIENKRIRINTRNKPFKGLQRVKIILTVVLLK